MPTVDVEVIVTARVFMPREYVFRGSGPRPLQFARLIGAAVTGRGEKIEGPCLAYIVRHPDAGTILIDTGMHPDVATDLRKDFGTAMSVVFRGIRPAGEAYDEQLRRRDVDPDKVDRVVMTHLHVDHTSGMRLLPNATFTITRDEWKAAHARRSADKGFIAHHLPPEDRVDLVDFEGDDRTIDLLGDGSITLMSTPGHTPGHMSVLLKTTGDRDVLIVGDAAYTLRSIETQTLPLLTAGDEQYAASLKELKDFSDSHPDAVIVPTHDPAAWERVRDLAPAG